MPAVADAGVARVHRVGGGFSRPRRDGDADAAEALRPRRDLRRVIPPRNEWRGARIYDHVGTAQHPTAKVVRALDVASDFNPKAQAAREGHVAIQRHVVHISGAGRLVRGKDPAVVAPSARQSDEFAARCQRRRVDEIVAVHDRQTEERRDVPGRSGELLRGLPRGLEQHVLTEEIAAGRPGERQLREDHERRAVFDRLAVGFQVLLQIGGNIRHDGARRDRRDAIETEHHSTSPE